MTRSNAASFVSICPRRDQRQPTAWASIGWIDETGVAKKGDKTPGVQRQYCGASGKIDNCIVTVHLAVRYGDFMALLDSDLFLPEESWDQDRDRCQRGPHPRSVVYRSKAQIALEQIKRAIANGVRFDWLTFDEWYGSKPAFLFELDRMGQHYVCEVPKNFLCFPSLPKYHSPQRPFAAKRVDNAAIWGKPFVGKKWRKITLQRQNPARRRPGRSRRRRSISPVTGEPTDRTYWLIVARNTRDRRDQILRLQRPAQNRPDHSAASGLHPRRRRARLPPGQERDRLCSLRGPQLPGAAAAHDPLPTGDAVRGRATDRPAAGGKTPGA